MEQQYISSREMHALETNGEYFGLSLLQLMENAGRSIALEIETRFTKDTKIAIFCGLGGNGGDGLVAARHLAAKGFSRVAVVIAGKGRDIFHQAARANWIILQNLNESIPIREVIDISELPTVELDVVVDALLGTGGKDRLKAPISGLVDYINSLKAFKVAADVPTGVDSDSGEVISNAVKADLTITFHRAKKGLEVAKNYAGEVVVADIGLPEEVESFAGPGDVLLATVNRRLASHKGDFGKALFIGGSEVYSGAPALMSMAALRTGLDVAYTAAPEKAAHDISSMSPNLITIKLDGPCLNPKNLTQLSGFLAVVDVVVVGPGAGVSPNTVEFMKTFIDAVEEKGKPLLLDADGLKAFAQFGRPLRVPLVLTPHAGEFAILAGKTLPEDLKGRIREVKKIAAKLKAVILLKGKVDIITDGKRVKLNFTGNPGMTVGGTGDVLTGVVGALLAQNNDPFEAAVAGAFVNGAAGDFVVERIGYHMVATDLLDFLPQALNDPMSHMKVLKPGKTS